MNRSKSKSVYHRYNRTEISSMYYSMFNRVEREETLNNLEQKLSALDSRIAAARAAKDAERVAKLMDTRNSVMQTLVRAGRIR